MRSDHRHPTLRAAAEALAAGRSAARLLVSPPCAPLDRQDGADPGRTGLAMRLAGKSSLTEAVATDVEALLAQCGAFIAKGTETRTDWMPK